jgi:hypothetical protein
MKKLLTLLFGLLASIGTIQAGSIDLLDSTVTVSESSVFGSSKTLYQYNDKGSLIRQTRVYASWSKWKVGVPMILNSKAVFVYDDEGHEIDVYYSALDTATGKWTDTHRYLYDEWHNRTYSIGKWNADSTELLSGVRYLYDSNHFLIGDESFDTWNGVKVIPNKYFYTNDENGYKISMYGLFRPDSAYEGDYMSDPVKFNQSGWKYVDSAYYERNAAGQSLRETFFRWDESNNQWLRDGYQDFTYDAQGHWLTDTVFARDFETNIITYNNMTVRTYDNYGNLTRSTTYSPIFSEGPVEWQVNYESVNEYTYNDKGQIATQRSYSVNNDGSQYGITNTTYYYSHHETDENGTIIPEPEPCLIASGTCGTNLKWELTCDSVLTITGSGAMSNWNYQNYAPWYSHRDKIVSVKVNEGVTSVGKYAFISCSVLESAELPNSVTTIGESGFGSCSKLKNINLGNGLISTGEWVFSHNPTLETITLPKSFTSLGNSSFNHCSNLKMIHVDPENTKYCSVDGVLFNKDTTMIVVYPLGREETTYALPNTVKTIGYGAFWGAKLTNIDLPEGLSTINTYGLGDCSSLESLTLPSTLTTIAGSGIRFALSTSHIKYVICKAVTPPSVGQYGLGLGAIPLYVPAESVETYKTNSNWKGFSPIRPIGSDPTVTFRDWDGTVLKIDTVEVGGTATPPTEIPEHEGSHFVGWDKDYSNVQYDIIVTAMFETNQYLVQFVDWDGTVLKSDSVWYMGWVEAPENPYRPGYAFTGWDRDFGYESLISDLVITAQYMQLDPGAVTITDGGAVNALFSVGEGKQVLFSRGNLQFNAAQGTHACADGTTQPGTWRFAGEQYYVRTWDNYTRCDSCDNWIDLFYYGTSGYNGVMPYRDDMDVETLQQVGNVEGTNYDFGVYNAISNGGNTPGAWRMFTIKEWRYLLQNRPHAYKLYNIVKINDVYGVVILPDNSDTTLLRQEINPEEYYYPYYAPSYSLNEWRQLEAKGAIFLPTGGVGSKYNGYFNVGAVNERGYYMTSYKPSSASTIMDCVGFDTTTVYTGGLSMSSAAISVRLVQDVDVFHLNAVSNNSAWGTVNGDSLYWNEAISMTATPNEGYHFVQWSDGVTDNPRTIVLSSDSTITAEFAPNIYSLTVTCDAEQGSISGKSGAFDYLSEHTFEAVANPGHTFLAWSDGVKENPRTIVLTHDSTITALYELGEYTDFIINVNTKDGELILSNNVVLKMPVAPQIAGFTFVGWRPVATIIENNTIDIEAVYTADVPSAAPEVTNPADPTQKLIREGNVYILKGDKIYSITGQKVK